MAAIGREAGQVIGEGTRIVFQLNKLEISGSNRDVQVSIREWERLPNSASFIFTHVMSDRYMDLDNGLCKQHPNCEERRKTHTCQVWKHPGPFTLEQFKKMLEVAPGTPVKDWAQNLQAIARQQAAEEEALYLKIDEEKRE